MHEENYKKVGVIDTGSSARGFAALGLKVFPAETAQEAREKMCIRDSTRGPRHAAAAHDAVLSCCTPKTNRRSHCRETFLVCFLRSAA